MQNTKLRIPATIIILIVIALTGLLIVRWRAIESAYYVGKAERLDIPVDTVSEEVLDYYGKAERVDPSNYHIYVSRGELYFEHEQYTEALADYEKVIELKPNDSLGYVLRAHAYSSKFSCCTQ